ncbi:MAG: ABC transporter ATP-binding protein [Candidatus Humimicrobiaceae bacterium]
MFLEPPDAGSILFEDQKITGKSSQAAVRKKMAASFQEPLLFKNTVWGNLVMGLKFRKIEFSQVKDKFYYYVEGLGLQKLLKRDARNLSSGEEQRVSLARALILDPQLLLLDEPLANIDQVSKEDLRSDLLGLLKEFGKSIIYVTHDRNGAMVLADYIAVINKGRIEQFGQRDEIFQKPVNEFVAKFVGVKTLVEGEIAENRENVCRIRVNGSSNIFAAGNKKEGSRVMVAIRPEDVIIYTDGLKTKSSALNLLKGNVYEIKDFGIFQKVLIDCGFNLVCFVTKSSINRLNLKKGAPVFCGIKASSIHLFDK